MVRALIAIKEIAKHVKVTQRVPSKVPAAHAPVRLLVIVSFQCAKGPIRFEIQMGRPAAHAPKGLGRFGLVRFEVQPRLKGSDLKSSPFQRACIREEHG